MYRNLLVPMDGSELSACSLMHVAGIALGCHVPTVTLLTVMEPPLQIYSEGGSESQLKARIQEMDQIHQRAVARAEEYLARAARELSKENVHARTEVIQANKDQGVAQVILDYAKNSGIDLIILSTHGRSGISRWAMGSIADRIVRTAAVPVLTVSPPGCRV